MDRSRPASSVTSRALLNRQLAGITDTLARASQRRDAEVRKMWSSRAQLDGAVSIGSLGSSRYAVSDTSSADMPSVSLKEAPTSSLTDDPRAKLAGLCGVAGASARSKAQNNDDNMDDVRTMLAELSRPISPPHTTTSVPGKDDAGQMQAELAALSAPGPQKAISRVSEGDEDEEEDDDDDINVLRLRLRNLKSNYSVTSEESADAANSERSISHDTHDDVIKSSSVLDRKVIPYVVALQLEHSDIQWDRAQGWTTYLYSSCLDGYEAQRKKGIAVAHAEHGLKKIIDSVLRVEDESRSKAEETKLQRRLIVSNLAAGADAEEVERQFWKHGYEM